jgi:hypothetical protein
MMIAAPKTAVIPLPFACRTCRHSCAQRPLTTLRTHVHEPGSSSRDMSADELIQQMLTTDPQAAENVRRVADAARNVAQLQVEQARLARALAEAESNAENSAELRERRAASEAADTIAAAEVQAAKLLLRAAELEAESAASRRAVAAQSAQTEEERLETAKAGTAAALGAIAASFPLVATNGGPALTALASLAGVAISGFLFGLVYRYALRQDTANTQLKAGVVAAFGLVRGVALAGEIAGRGLVSSAGEVDVQVLGTVAATAGESMLLFGFSCVALEAAFARGLVRPFAGVGAVGEKDAV